jgi:PadR family transcriptional regulator AphA
VATVHDRKTVTLSTTELSVLGLLTAFGEHSGYDLKKHAEAGVGYVWTAAKSQIYAVLPRLVAGGYATARHVEQSSRPDKQVYRITAKGEETFRAWLEEPVE